MSIKLTEEELKEKAIEIAKRALIMPLPASLVRNLGNGVTDNYVGDDVCPYCGSPNFQSGLLRNLGKEWGKPGESLDNYIFVCSDCRSRFESPEEKEPLNYWYVRDYWVDWLIVVGETLMRLAPASHTIWLCDSDDAYTNDAWVEIAKKLYREKPTWGFWR